MSKHWETEFWGLLSPGTILRLKAELGLHAKYREPPVETEAQFAAREFGIGPTTDANSAPPAVHSAPEPTGGAFIPGEGDRVRLYELPYMRKYRDGTVMRFLPDTPAGHCRVLWDTPLEDHITVEDMDRLEVVR